MKTPFDTVHINFMKRCAQAAKRPFENKRFGRVRPGLAGAIWVRLLAALWLLVLLLTLAAPRVAMAGGAWSTAAAMPNPRSELAVAALDGRIYVAGGLRSFGASRIFERYDPAADGWQRLADLPRALHHFAMAGLDGRIVLTGGYTGPDFSADNAETWAYDPARDAWSRRADLPAPRVAHAAAVLGGRLYVVGGVGPRDTALWVYDPAGDRWVDTHAPLPQAREHLAAAALDGRLYAVGGRWYVVGGGTGAGWRTIFTLSDKVKVYAP